MQEREPLGSAATIRLSIGQQLVPQRLGAAEAARGAQPPALVDLGKLVAVIGRLDDPDATGIGRVVAEPREAAVDAELLLDRRWTVSEAPVDPAFAGRQARDRISRVGDAVVQFGVHRAQDAAAAVRRRDPDERDARHRQNRAAWHGQPQIEVVGHADDVAAVACEDRAVGRHQRPPRRQRFRMAEPPETGGVQQRYRRPVRVRGGADFQSGRCVRGEHGTRRCHKAMSERIRISCSADTVEWHGRSARHGDRSDALPR